MALPFSEVGESVQVLEDENNYSLNGTSKNLRSFTMPDIPNAHSLASPVPVFRAVTLELVAAVTLIVEFFISPSRPAAHHFAHRLFVPRFSVVGTLILRIQIVSFPGAPIFPFSRFTIFRITKKGSIPSVMLESKKATQVSPRLPSMSAANSGRNLSYHGLPQLVCAISAHRTEGLLVVLAAWRVEESDLGDMG